MVLQIKHQYANIICEQKRFLFRVKIEMNFDDYCLLYTKIN